MAPVAPPPGAADPLPPATTPASTKVDEGEWTAIVPIPEPLPALPKHSRFGPIQTLYTYSTPDGKIAGYVCRWDQTNGKGAKEIRPLTYGFMPGKPPAWGWRTWPKPRPLFGLDKIAAAPGAPVLVVEGEKTALAAAQYLPPGWLVTTAPGGAKAALLADWTALQDHPVVIWPDKDQPGFSYAVGASRSLAGVCSSLRVVTVPSDLPEGWDLADPLPPTLSASGVTALIDAPLAAQQPIGTPLGTSIDMQSSFVHLGYANGKYYFMNKLTSEVVDMTPQDLGNSVCLFKLNPDYFYWAQQADENGGGKPNWPLVSSRLQAASQNTGKFDHNELRGRGCWLDNKRLIVHLGDKTIVDGVECRPADVVSRYAYISGSPMIDTFPAPLDDAESRQLLNLSRKIRWASPMYGELFAGWIATAGICGALKWRSHIWITGALGTGKSWIADQVIGPVIGNLGVYAYGASSEAGIRQSLKPHELAGSDARAVIVDEAETKSGQVGRYKREEILELMRQASSDSRATILRGSGTHRAVSFHIRSSFCLLSIAVELKQAAMASRTAILALDSGIITKAAQEQHFRDMRQHVKKLGGNYGERLLARMVKLFPVFQQCVETFGEAIAEQENLGGRRMGDQIGTLLAGAWMLRSSQPISKADAVAFLKVRDWTDFNTKAAASDEMNVLHHILSQILVVQTPSARYERTIGELIALCSFSPADEKITETEARQTLGRFGIRYKSASDLLPASPSGMITTEGIFISNSHPNLRAMMAEYEYSEGWWRIIQRHPACKTASKPLSFHKGFSSHAQFFPITSLIKSTLEEYADDPPKP